MRTKVALGLMVALLLAAGPAPPPSSTAPPARDEPSDSADHASRSTPPAPRSTFLAAGHPASQALAAVLLAAVEGETDPDRRSEALEGAARSVSEADLPAVLDALVRDAGPAAAELCPLSSGAGPKRTRRRRQHGPHNFLKAQCAVPPWSKSPSPGPNRPGRRHPLG